MKAIILAAGQASRLRPITKNTPKCLLKIKGTSIIDHQVDTLYKNGINEIIVVVGFRSKKIIDYLVNHHHEIKFHFIFNKKFKETKAAYSLWLARKYLKDPVLYLNSDVFFSPEIIKNIIKSKNSSVTAIQRVPWDEEEVNVITQKNMQIIEIGKHIDEKLSCGEFIGITKLGKEFNKNLIKTLDYFIKKKEYQKFAADAINLAIKNYGGKIYALDVTSWPAIEIDTIDDFKRAQEMKKI